MQEYALYGQVSSHDYPRLLQQLAGVTRMQPRYVQELHLVFKANVPPGLSLIPTATSSERLANPDAQRISKMLTASLHYVQLVGTIETVRKSHSNGDVEMTNDSGHRATKRKIRWEMEFKDTPEPGKQVVSSRQVSRTPIDDGDVMGFMQAFGFGYVSRYMIEGAKFYDQDTTIFLYRASKIIPPTGATTAMSTSFLESNDGLELLDGTGGYLLQASINAVDGVNTDLKDRATSQLLAMKETLKQAVELTPGDRLSMDTKVKVTKRP